MAGSWRGKRGQWRILLLTLCRKVPDEAVGKVLGKAGQLWGFPTVSWSPKLPNL